MNNNLLRLLPFLLFFFQITAQEKIPFVDYAEVAAKAAKSSEKGDYEKTLEHLNKISKNDSTYCSVMVTKTYYLLNLKKYEQTIEVANKGLEDDCYDSHSLFYINKVVALLRQDQGNEANKVCNEGLKRFPQNKTLWYNKGVALEKIGKVEEAVTAYQKTILLNPFYRNSYLQLGNICYKQELISQALMCYNMYLLLEPDADNAFNILKSINDIVKSKNENSKNTELKVSKDDESFEELDLIINNRIALNEKYDTGNEIDIALIKQNHVLLSSLKNFSGNGGFWDTSFVPFYEWVINNDYFDVFSYTLSYSIENETYKKIIEKKVKEITEFLDLSKQKWSGIVKNIGLPSNDSKKNLTHFFEDGYMKGIGKTENGVLLGPWELFNKNGRFTAKGPFSSNGKRDGEWIWYNDKGKIREIAHYTDGKLNGSNIQYYENGRQEIIANYRGDNLHGEYLYYNKNGALQQKKYFKNGKLDGLYKSYHDVGEELIKSEGTYVNGAINEKYIEYFPTGNISSEINFKNGKANGQEIKFHHNGNLSLDIISKNGFVDGYFKKLHSNGNPQEVGQTVEGNYIGHWQTFYSNNTLESDFSYNGKGELDGEYKNYDTDEKLHYVFEYRKGEFIAYQYYDKEGNIIDANSKKGGEFYYKGYSPFGKIISEGLYDIKGGKKGKWKYYSSHGILTDEGVYEDNKAQGEYKTYYSDGAVESISMYKNDTLSGYYIKYHKNGEMQRQGWYKDDNVHGEWRTYTPDGTVKEINFYHKGLLHGEQHLFSGIGPKTKASFYNYGEGVKDIYFGKEGNILYTIDYASDKGEYILIFKHHNGKPSSKITYVNGVKHGAYSFFDFYGRKRTSGEYLNGKLHGEFTWYHENGNVEIKANYFNGELEGDYIYYFEDGTIDSKYFYALGKLQKESVSYHENGSIKSKSEYSDGERHGRRESNSPNGKLQLVRFYNHGRLMGYSYLDKSSKELPMVPIDHETGKMVAYYDNGKVSREAEYKTGDLVDVYKEYYYSGQLLEETHYAKGELDGKRTMYFQNGTLKEDREYILGKLNGVVKEYYENGNTKKEETYLNGIKEGDTKKYDNKGKLIIKEYYFDGSIISSTSK